MSSGSKKGNPDMHFLFLSKVPVNEPSSTFPNRVPMERAAYLQGLFYIFLKFIVKISLNKENFPSPKGSRKGVFLHVPQKRGLYGNRPPFPEPYLAYPSGP